MAISPAWPLAIACLLASPDGLEPLGKIADPTIRETSGIIASRKHAGVFWIHGDSGNPPVLHAIRRDGTVLASVRVAIPNVDWEDIATDDAGHLYLGEIGNNGGLLPIRAVYRIDEPDPSRPPKGDIPVIAATFYRARFDAECLIVADGRIYAISKRKDGSEAEIYALPDAQQTSLTRPAAPRRVGVVSGFVEPATAADLSADRKRLAVASTTVARVYDRAEDGGLTLRGVVRYADSQVEAIAWDGPDLILADEGGRLFRIAEATWSRRRGGRP